MAGGRIDVEVGVDGRGFASAFRRTVEGGARGAFSALAGIAKTTLVAAGAAGGALFATSLAKGWGRLTAIEDAQAKLRGLGHSAESVTTIMDNALQSVRGTAFGLGDAATVAAGAVAAGIAPGEDLERVLKNVADAAYIGGSSLGEMGSIFNKVATDGRIQADVINQLNDRGIPILTLLADQLGVTAEEVRKLASDGKVSFADFQAAMEAGMGGAALKSAETTRGAIDNFGAALSRLGAASLGGVFPHIRDGFVGMTNLVDLATPAFENFGLRAGLALTNFRDDASRAYSDFILAFDGQGGTSIPATLGRLASEAQAKLGPLGEIIGDALSAKVERAGQVFTEVLVPAAMGAVEILSRLAGPLQEVGSAVGSAFSAAVSAAGDALGVFSSHADAIGDRVEWVANILSGIAQNALPVFTGALQVGVGVLDGALTILSALTAVLEPLQPLLTGLGTAAVVAFAAFKGYTVLESAGAAFSAWATTLSTKVASGLQTAGANAMVLTEQIGGSGRAADAVGGAFSNAAGKATGFGGVMSKIGNNLPLIGAGIAAVAGIVSLVADAMNESEKRISDTSEQFESVFESLGKGGYEARSAQDALAGMAAEAQRLRDMDLGFIADDIEQGMANAKEAIDEAAESMSNLEKAELAVEAATNDLIFAIDTYGEGSAHAKEAADELAAAEADLKAEKEKLAAATKSVTDALVEQANQALAASNASLGLRQTLLNSKKTIEEANAVLADGTSTADERTQAEINLELAYNKTIESANKAAEANNAGAEGSRLAGLQAYEQNKALRELAATSGVELPASMQATIAANNRTIASALLTEDAFEAVSKSIVDVPDSKSVVLSDNSPETIAKLEALNYKVTHLENGNILVTATDLATQQAKNIVSGIGAMVATINVKTNYTPSAPPSGVGAKWDFAAGGFYTPMAAGRAEIVQPNTWRIVGDNTRVPEAYIPIDRANARSRALLEETARRMGYQLKAFAQGGFHGGASVAVAGPQRFEGNLYLDSGQLLGLVRGEVRAGLSDYDTTQTRQAQFGTVKA